MDRSLQVRLLARCAAGVRLLPLSVSAAVRAAELTGLHGDPADRLIAATALELRAKLVTKDVRLLDWASGHPSGTAIW